MNSVPTLIIMPAYNVQKKISQLLDKMQAYSNRLLVINDGSQDQTADIITEKGFCVLNNDVNQGISYCIKKGICWAKEQGFENVILMDSDGQHDPQFISPFEKALEDCDFVYGNRFKNNLYIPSPKIASNMLASILVNIVWGCKIYDTACGFKAFRLGKGIEDSINQRGRYSLVYNILFYTLHNKLRIGSIDMEAIYYVDELWYTRAEELKAFILALESYAVIENNGITEVSCLKEKVWGKKDFQICISDISFSGFYLKEKDGYVVQGDLEKNISVCKWKLTSIKGDKYV